MSSRFFLALFIGIFFFGYASAVFITVSAVNGPFVTDSNILVIIKVFENNGSAKSNVDVNSYLVNNLTGDVNTNSIAYSGSVQGTAFRIIRLSTAGDFNLVAIDLNDNISATVRINVGTIRSGSVTFNNHNPPYNISTGEDINFTVQGKNAASSDVNIMLRARLISDANGQAASPTFDINANGRDQNMIDTTNLSAGLYYIDVNNGLLIFPVTVYKFKGFMDLKDDQNNATNVLGAGSTVIINLKATNYDENVTQTISSATVTVTQPEGDSNSSIPCVGTDQRICRYVVPSDANEGEYAVSATMTVGSDTLRVRRTFSVQTYQMSFFAQKFSGGDTGIEKMPSVYPTNSSVAFEAHFVNAASTVELSGADLNRTFCQDANISVFIQKSGDRDRNRITDTTTWGSANPAFCVVTITAPSKQGNYVVTAETSYGTRKFSKSTMLVVQNFMIFLAPVAPDTFDAATPSGKFTFFKGEKVGFNPSYVDLNGSLNPAIVAVRSIQVTEASGVKTFRGSDVNWHTDKNMLSLSVAAVNTLSGGFNPVTATVDVNCSSTCGPDGNVIGVTAIGMFKLSVLSISATVVDSNNAVTSSQKTQHFGPMSVGMDENIFIKVTAAAGSGTGISGATATLKTLNNVDTWQRVTVSSIASKVTDSNGVAIIDVGKLNSLGLASGGYFGSVEVITSDGNVDSAEFFFEARSFMVFLQPADANCNFVQNFRRDENASFVIWAFNPKQGFGGGDVNISVASTGALTLYYFGSPSKPQFPPTRMANINYDVNTSYLCPAGGFMGPGSGQNRTATRITIRGASDANWTTGFYSPSLAVTGRGGDVNGVPEVGRGFMKVQSFGFLANPAKVNQFGPPIGKPGSPFDINVTVLGADSNVSITAKLVDIQGGGHLEFEGGGTGGTGSGKDLNIGLNRPGAIYDCNANRCHAKDVNVINSRSPRLQDSNTVKVLIPSGAKVQEYLIVLTATDRSGSTAEAEIFLTTKLFRVVNLSWFQSLFGVYGLQNTAPADWNTTGARFAQVYQYSGQAQGGGPTSPPNIDLNFLVDYTGRVLVVDVNKDRNFMSTGDSNVAVGGQFRNNDGNVFIITDISRVGNEPGVKLIRLSAVDSNDAQFGYVGEYAADANFTVPILVKDFNGSALDSNVTVTNIGQFTPGSFYPTMFATRSCSSIAELRYCNLSNDFNALYAQTDANGLALLNLRVAKPGSFLMLEVTVWNTTGGTTLRQTQRLQPFEGPTVNVKKYTVSTKVTGPTFTLTHDRNVLADLNTNGTGLTNYVADANYGRIVGSDSNNSILGDTNDTTTFYFVKMWGVPGPPAILIDDDTNFARNAGPTFTDGNVAEAGDFIESVCYDFNSDCVMTRRDGTSVTAIYFDRNATDANIFDNNTIFYPVYTNPYNPFGSTAPNHDANIQIAVSLTDLSGNASPDTYSISNVRLENFATFSTTAVTCTNCTNKTGTTIINLGNFSSRRTPGAYNAVFTLTVGTSTTEERTFFDVRRPS